MPVDERLIPDDRQGAKDGVTESQSLRLTHVDTFDACRKDLAHRLEHLGLAAGGKLALDLEGAVKVVLDRTLAAAGDEDHFCNAGGDRLTRLQPFGSVEAVVEKCGKAAPGFA